MVTSKRHVEYNIMDYTRDKHYSPNPGKEYGKVIHDNDRRIVSLKQLLRDRYFWYIFILIIFTGIFTYAPNITALAGTGSPPEWELAFYTAFYRTVFILCAVIASWRFGFVGGIVTTAIITPVLFSPLFFGLRTLNVWLEIGVVLFSIIVCFIIGRQGDMQRQLAKNAADFHHQATQLKLEIAERENTEKELRTLSLHAIESLVFALEAKDKYTAGHSRRVTNIAVLIGNRMCLPANNLEDLRCASLLHDIGKIGIDQLIQNKPDTLTDYEYAHVMQHTDSGANIVRPVVNSNVVELIEHHHDHFDGTGLNQKNKGSEIPLGARIIAVADAFDAMTSNRPYRLAMTAIEAVAEIKRCTGTQFDPDIVEAFLQIPLNEIY